MEVNSLLMSLDSGSIRVPIKSDNSVFRTQNSVRREVIASNNILVAESFMASSGSSSSTWSDSVAADPGVLRCFGGIIFVAWYAIIVCTVTRFRSVLLKAFFHFFGVLGVKLKSKLFRACLLQHDGSDVIYLTICNNFCCSL